jgi:phosphoribosyl 1,2-cyclic phosphodiesterase
MRRTANGRSDARRCVRNPSRTAAPPSVIGYRIELDGKSLCYIPDHDPALGKDLTTVDPAWISGFTIARDADVLLHDSQYTQEEYDLRLGWGHSSIKNVVDYQTMTGAKRLLMFHHDPTHSDEQLESKLAEARAYAGADNIELAREGMTVEV